MKESRLADWKTYMTIFEWIKSMTYLYNMIEAVKKKTALKPIYVFFVVGSF